jgi:hypothetical protein
MLYQSSKGGVEISTMPLSYAKNALNKLNRTEPERAAEIAALTEHVEKLSAEATEKSLNPRAEIGGNNPPPEAQIKPEWEAVKIHMDDLLTEARNWADGEAIDNQDKADAVGRLRQLLQDAANLADKARVAEKKPLDDAISEIQDRYNEYIAPLKNKKPGTVSKAVAALGNLLNPWLNKLDAERRERENKAREEAEKAQAAALAARQEAKAADDLSIMDAAEGLLAEAEEAAKTLRSVEKEKVQVAGEFRAIGLRSTWRAQLREGEGGKALVHYAKAQPERVKGFLQQLADEDVRRGAREIPGFEVIEERKVA